MRTTYLIFVFIIITASTAVFWHQSVRADDNIYKEKNYTLHPHLAFYDLHFLKNRSQHGINDQLILAGDLDFIYDNKRNFFLRLKPRIRLDFLDADNNRYLPDEAYAKVHSRIWAVSAGLQVLSFGVSHFYNPVDVFNRRDLKQNIYDPKKMGELVLDFLGSWQHVGFIDELSLRFMILPFFEETPQPQNDTRFAIAGNFGIVPYQLDSGQTRPATYLKSLGLGFLLSSRIKSLEVGLIFYHGPSHIPGYYLTTNSSGALRARPFYYTIDMLGAEFSLPVASFLFHVEVALNITAENNRVTHNIPGQTTDLVPNTYFQYVPGVDYTIDHFFGSGILRMTLEYYGENHHSLQLGEYRPFKNDLFLGFDYDFNNKALMHLSFGFLKDLSNTELMCRLHYATHIYRGLKLDLDAILVGRDGDANAPFSYFENNSFVSSQLAYSW